MSPQGTQLSNPFSTGGGGVFFEMQVQGAFAVLMLSEGFAPCLPTWPIKKIKFQGKFLGYNTDDFIAFVKNPSNDGDHKLLAQIKHQVSITQSDTTFGEVIQSAWADFSNADLFNPNKDVIALITGPLSKTDIENVRPILEWARNSENAHEFIETKVEQANFSSVDKKTKLNAFRTHLSNAKGSLVTDDELWRFMKIFHLLGYDLDIKAGVTHSLLHSLICQYSPDNAQNIWLQILDEVRSANQTAGTLTIESFSDDIREAFKEKATRTIPIEFLPDEPSLIEVSSSSTSPGIESISKEYPPELALAMLVGSWNEASENDKAIIQRISGTDYNDFIKPLRENLFDSKSPLTLKNGNWKANNRHELLKTIGSKLFNDQLDRFKESVIVVLKERDPKFELSSQEQFVANLYGKTLSNSHILRRGLAEGLALLGSHSDALISCDTNKSEEIALLAVREILSKADWIQWASINDLLPLLAEASPREFLDAVESGLSSNPCPFDILYAQESDGVFGTTYISGLLWSLETIAWDPDFFLRAIVLLGELAARDPGGRWGNRPSNSLITIFLPWLPQTCAPITKRNIAVEILTREQPEVAWKLLLSLLPQAHQVSSGSRKPEWRKMLCEEKTKSVSRQDYSDQINYFTNLAITLSKGDTSKLAELIDLLSRFPPLFQEKLLAQVGAEEIISKTDEVKLPLWNKLMDLITRHRKYSDTDWAMKADQLERISAIAERLKPLNPLYYNQRLFNQRTMDLFETDGEFTQQIEKLNEIRRKAITDIFSIGKMQDVLDFANIVEDPQSVGISAGSAGLEESDSTILPALLDSEKASMAGFVRGFVFGKFNSKGWQWIDFLDLSNWSAQQIGQFFNYLPFTSDTWIRVSKFLKDDESPYWCKTNARFVNPEDEYEYAINRLIQFNKPFEAISCLYHVWFVKKYLNIDLAIQSLIAAVKSDEKLTHIDTHEITEIIKILQKDPRTDPNDLFQIEWAYLPLLDRYNDAAPKTLEFKLANEPSFFCEIIRLVFRSKNEESSEIVLTEEQMRIATNAYHLLSEWKTPPGTIPDGNFSGDKLNEWFNAVKKECTETGHFKIAMQHAGQVLIHAPADPDGLWIHHSVAKVLDAKDDEDIREGYRISRFNSRGAFFFSEGKEEKALADTFRNEVDDVESRGYFRFADLLRRMAESYDKDAKNAATDTLFDK